ncbi:hypothetical protein [Streptomyces sp. G45]|uniref:hypothetical protein n=1 Tax=Streptomyces sp. G45 TaxID=3406627 RepID=UPI003C232A6A
MTDERHGAPRGRLGGMKEFAELTGELEAVIRAGGFWRLAPSWVPRGGYATPTPDCLRAVEAGLRRLG